MSGAAAAVAQPLPLHDAVAERGASAFPWWPDWRGQCVAIVASGPSAKPQNLAALRGRIKVVAIKQSYDLVPFCDLVYGCDAPWWRHRRGLPEFKGLKVCHDVPGRAVFADVAAIRIDRSSDRILLREPGLVGNGGNSGFQALNLAVQFGARAILLIGFDCSDRSGVHWYGRNNWSLASNPDDNNFRRWIAAYENAATVLEGLGIDVVTAIAPAAAHTELKAFRRCSIERALQDWNL